MRYGIDEDFRRQCEARDWLRRRTDARGKLDVEGVEATLGRIAKRRGADAAAALRAEMRLQWRNRRDWLQLPDGVTW